MNVLEYISPDLRLVISENPIDVGSEYSFLCAPEAGGIDIFVGTTRKLTDGKETTRLVYECYPEMALREMRRLAEVAVAEWPIRRVCMVHRVGTVPVGESSIFIGVATPHRAEAFAACRFLIDNLKRDVPIWKYEQYADGSGEWVGAGTLKH